MSTDFPPQAVDLEIPPNESVNGFIFADQLPTTLADGVRRERARPGGQEYAGSWACYQTDGFSQRWPRRARLSQAELSPATAIRSASRENCRRWRTPCLWRSNQQGDEL